MGLFGLHPLRNANLQVELAQVVRRSLFKMRRAISRPGHLPDIIILGAQRAGTTSLFNALKQHPDIQPAIRKEVHYFDLHYRKGQAWYRSWFATPFWQKDPDSIRWMEATPYYLFHPQVPQRMKQTIPDARLIVLLRNPIDRAFSDYQWQRRMKKESLSFEEALAAETERTAGEEERLISDQDYVSEAHNRYSYIARGLYARQLERWYNHFPADRLMVLPAESFFLNMAQSLKQIEEFAELPPKTYHGLKSYNAVRYSPMAPHVRERLRDIFREDKHSLEKLTGLAFDWDF